MLILGICLLLPIGNSGRTFFPPIVRNFPSQLTNPANNDSTMMPMCPGVNNTSPFSGVLEPAGQRDTPGMGFGYPICPENTTPSFTAPPVYVSIYLNQEKRAENGDAAQINPVNVPINITLIYNYIVNRPEPSPVVPAPVIPIRRKTVLPFPYYPIQPYAY